jgi:sulfate transport system permease protein
VLVTEKSINAAGIEVEREVERVVPRPWRPLEAIAEFFHQLTRPAAAAALWLSVWTAAVMTLINVVAGTLTAYVLVRYRFPGRALLNAVIDLPFAIPTLVTGVMLVILYGPQAALGSFLSQRLGWEILFAPPGVVLALLFVCFPLVVRTVQPVVAELERDQEEAAWLLGAGAVQTIWRVLLPQLAPAIASGALLAFARALGEFGSIVVVAGNIPMHSQTAAVYVLGEIESDNRGGASAMSVALLALSFALVLLVERLQRHRRSRHA